VYGRKLRRFLAARMRNAAADVQDLTQEVYLRLLRVEDHEVIRNPQAYLFTIASHVLHQHLLRQATRPHAMEYTDVVSAIQAVDETDPATLAEVEQRFDNVARALEKASPRAYATLVMHRRDGVPLTEIAVRLGVSYTMTKRYLARALSYCQQHLDESE
jgi:RNA polymerase sigma-70 factor (ECF subfamily)